MSSMTPGGRTWKLGENVDTDVLAPGRYMKFAIEEIASITALRRLRER